MRPRIFDDDSDEEGVQEDTSDLALSPIPMRSIYQDNIGLFDDDGQEKEVDTTPEPDLAEDPDAPPPADDALRTWDLSKVGLLQDDDEEMSSSDDDAPISNMVAKRPRSASSLKEMPPASRQRVSNEVIVIDDDEDEGDGTTRTPEEIVTEIESTNQPINGRLPFDHLLTNEQKAAIENCIGSTGHMVIANTGWGKSFTILGVAAHFAYRRQPVLLLVRKSTEAEFNRLLDTFEPRPRIQLMVHETFVKYGKEYMNLATGNVRRSRKLELFMPSNTVVLIDECQQFASSTIMNAKKEAKLAPLVAMALCAAQATRVYLFSATPCSDEPNELKSLLYLIKHIAPPGTNRASSFDDKKLGDYFVTLDGVRANETLSNGESPISFNFRCLVSYYFPDKSAATYLNNWVNLVTQRVEVVMTPTERRRFEQIERQGGWSSFASRLRKASETESKMQAMFEIVRHEISRFKGKNVKPRVMIYTYLKDYADEIHNALLSHPKLRKLNPIRLQAGEFDVTRQEIRPFASKFGNSYIAIITDAGVTGFNPPPLTSIIAMNAFWTPASRIQLEGRLNRYTRHNFLNSMNIEKTMRVYQLLAVKAKGENASEATNDIVKPYGFDSRQNFIVDEKALTLAVAMKELCRASKQYLSANDCTAQNIASKIASSVEFL